MKLIVYGLKNCDTCRAAQRWLKARDVPFIYHDVRADGLTKSVLNSWVSSDQRAKLLNRRSTTWRKLSEEQRQSAETHLADLLLANPTLIKRPVFTDGETVLDIGFSPENLEKIL